MKKIIFIFTLFITGVCFGQTPCVTPNPTQCNTVINGSLVFGPLCTTTWGNIIVPVSAGGLNRSTLPANGEMLMSNGSNYVAINPNTLYLAIPDTNTIVMTRHDADSAITVMQTAIAGKISTEIDPNVPSYSKSLTAFSVIKSSTDPLYATTAQGTLATTALQPTGNGSTLTGLLKSQVGLSNCDNTSDVNKPVSSAQAASIATKFIIPTGTTSQYLRGDGSLATFPNIYSFTGTGSQYTKGDGTYGTLSSAYIPSINSATRTIATTSGVSTYTISSTLQSAVYYNVTIACTASIGSASTGTVILQYSTNGGSTWITAQEATNSNVVTLAVALNSVTTQSSTISAVIPANALVQLLKTSSGTTTITYIRGQEIY